MIDIDMRYRGATIVVRHASPQEVTRELEAAKQAIDSGEAKAETRGPLAAYRSHKVVYAAKITAVGFDSDRRTLLNVSGHDGDPGKITPPDGWDNRFKGTEGDLGYYVEYEDGYASWSPSKAFETGYTRI